MATCDICDRPLAPDDLIAAGIPKVACWRGWSGAPTEGTLAAAYAVDCLRLGYARQHARAERNEMVLEAWRGHFERLCDALYPDSIGKQRLISWTNLIEKAQRPIDMVLHCPNPKCGLQHVDAPEPGTDWNNPPHKSHKCHNCGTIWRPADVPTNGVAAIATRGTADTWPRSLVGTLYEPCAKCGRTKGEHRDRIGGGLECPAAKATTE